MNFNKNSEWSERRIIQPPGRMPMRSSNLKPSNNEDDDGDNVDSKKIADELHSKSFEQLSNKGVNSSIDTGTSFLTDAFADSTWAKLSESVKTMTRSSSIYPEIYGIQKQNIWKASVKKPPIRVPIEQQLKYNEEDDLQYGEIDSPNDTSRDDIDQSTLVLSKETCSGWSVSKLKNPLANFSEPIEKAATKFSELDDTSKRKVLTTSIKKPPMRVPIEHQMKYIENDDLQYGEDAVTSDITGDDVHSFVSSSLQMKTDHYTTLKLKSSTLSCDRLDRRDFNLSSIKEEQDVTSSVQTNSLFITDSTAVSTLARLSGPLNTSGVISTETFGACKLNVSTTSVKKLPIRVPIEHQLKYTEDDDLLYEEENVPNDISKENVDQSTLVISKETTPGLDILRLENSITSYERCDKKELNSLKFEPSTNKDVLDAIHSYKAGPALPFYSNSHDGIAATASNSTSIIKKKIEPPRRVSKEEAELMSKLYYESEDDCISQEDIINNSNYVEKLMDSSCSTIDPTFEASTFLPKTTFAHDDPASCSSNLNDGNFISVSNYSSINKSLIESFVDVSANHLLAHQDNETKTFQQQQCIEDAFISSPTIDSLFGKNTDLPKLRSSYGLFQQVDDPFITKDFMKSDLFDVCSLKEGSKVQPPHSSHTLSTVDNNNLLKSETHQQRLPFNVSPPSSARYRDKENIELNSKAECKASDEHHPAKKENGLWIRKRYFTKHHVIGNGGFSVVYKASSDDIKDCAIKCISLDAGDDSTISNYMTEIHIMKQLKGEQGIIQLFDYFLDKRESKLYLVMERGDTDLKSFYNSHLSLHPHKKESLIKFCWKGMLTSVQILHKNKIIHLDLKPANFILVNDQLKVIDFGISKRVNPDNTSVTCNDIAGTCNFMSPESLCNIDYNSTKVKIGVKSDVWSLGCILYYLVYGAPPFHKITNNLMKALAIMNGTYDIQYPENDLGSLLAPTIKKCLARESKLRPSIEDLLSDPFLHQ